jgi:hypothetical protein
LVLFYLPSDGALSTEIMYIFLAPILQSDWLNFAVQYHYEEEVGHLFTVFDLPLYGALNSEMICIYLAPPLHADLQLSPIPQRYDFICGSTTKSSGQSL